MVTIVTRAGKGAALTWTEGDANITNLNTGKLENVVEDTTPQLGGQLDVNGNAIVSTSNGNINISPNGSGNISLTPATGKIILGALDFPTGMGSNGQVLTTNGSSAMTWTTPAAAFDPASPGAIGATTASTGAFTTLSATGGLSVQSGSLLSKLNVNLGGITLGYNTAGVSQPRLTLPAGATGAMDTINIGAVNPGTGAFTTLSASSTVSGTGFSTYLASPPAIGATTAATGRFTTLTLSAQSITSISTETNGDLQITPNGTGTTAIKNLEYQENVYAIGTTSGTITPNAVNGNIQTITLNGNITFNALQGPISGQTVTFIITQSASGNNTLTSTMKFAGGLKTLSTAANAIDILTVSYIGTTYYASLSKGFA
jgi:hypothetical protein